MFSVGCFGTYSLLFNPYPSFEVVECDDENFMAFDDIVIYCFFDCYDNVLIVIAVAVAVVAAQLHKFIAGQVR